MQQMNMEENEISCCGMQSSCHGREPQKEIIEGTFEIDKSPWMTFCAARTSIYVRIYSSQKVDPSNMKGLASKKIDLSNAKVEARKKVPIMKKKINLPTEIIKFKLRFEVEQGFGSPGAFIIENNDKHEFFLKSAVLKYITSATENKDHSFHFNCNSWVYPLHKAAAKRIFFVNELYLPKATPDGLKELRKKELLKLRGGSKHERKPWDRIYEYDFYNDLGDPDNSRQFARPVLGGSTEFPYPRRLRTGRPPCQDEHSTESRATTGCFQTYVPPDEQMSDEKQEELRNNFVDALVRFLSLRLDKPQWSSPYLVKKIVHFFVPEAAFPTGEFEMIQSMVDFFKRKLKLSSSSSNQNNRNPNLVDNVLDMFSDKEIKGMEECVKKRLKKLLPDDIFNQVVANASEGKIVNSQLPSIIAENKFSWVEGKEFGRQMLAGTNPVRIQLLKEFPSGSNWPKEVKDNVEKAIEEKKAFILEHKDYLLPFLNMINGKGVCAYATRTILLRSKWDSTIDPIAIELSLSDPESSMVIVPGKDESDYRWELAITHVTANDAAHHQLVSHWLHTHAVVEPFIIATRRQLSIMHPIHRLLDPHFKDTLHINALARRIFLNAGGILETLLFTGEASMLLSSECYKKWRFDKQALPQDLVQRGMAVEENMINEPVENEPKNEFPTGVKLILEDYPYAKDGLEIWHAITTWVNAYCQHFYNSDDSVKTDVEIEAWWKEITEKGHGDQKEGWYELTTRENLVKALTTLIWITSGLHAAVNFGQYAYMAWPPNRPMLLRKFIPRQDQKEELDELKNDPDKFFMEMLPDKFDMALVMAITDTLSRHTSNEVYLGQMPPESGEEYLGQKPQEKELKDNDLNNKYEAFRKKLEKIQDNIMERNKTYRLINRWGYAKIPYKLLYPDTTKTKLTSNDKEDITGRGVPNSISI